MKSQLTFNSLYTFNDYLLFITKLNCIQQLTIFSLSHQLHHQKDYRTRNTVEELYHRSNTYEQAKYIATAKKEMPVCEKNCICSYVSHQLFRFICERKLEDAIGYRSDLTFFG